MIKHTNRFIVAVLLLGWAFDFLFWGHEPGISFAIFVGLTLLTGVVILRLEGLRPTRLSLVLLLPVAIFAIMTFTRREPMTVGISFFMTLLLMAVFVVTFMGGRWWLYSLTDYVVRAFQLIGSVFIAPLVFSLSARGKPQPVENPDGEQQGEVKTEKVRTSLWPLVRGILIAVPIIAIFAALLSSADLVFAQRLQGFIELFKLEKLPEYIFRMVYIVILAYMLAGILLHAAQKSGDEKLFGLEKPLMPRFLGYTEAVIVLGAVVILFAFFVFIQFQYFFGGQGNITIDGYTYAEYARRGFGELVAVALFSLLLFLGLSAITQRETPARQHVFTGLGVALVALVFVMLLSAYYRLTLYEQAYGFSRLRAYTHVFIIWLAVLLAATVVLDLLQRQRAFAFVAILVLIGFVASLGILNVDAFIVNRNVERSENGYPLDVAYLASLSADAVPSLADWFNADETTQSTRDMVGVTLKCMSAQNEYGQFQTWQSFTLSEWRAGQAMQSVDLSEYTYEEDRQDENGYWLPPVITTPLGEEIECNPYYMD